MSEFSEPLFSIVIGTYAAVPYVHLHLESHRRFYPEIPCLVCDDCSPKAEELATLCRKYDVQFHCNPVRLGHSHGDWSFFQYGLSNCRTPYLLKFSRRFVPFANIIQTLPTDGATITEQFAPSVSYLRSEAIALRVQDWRDLIQPKDLPHIYVEKELTSLSKRLYGFQELGYRNNQTYYTRWSLLGYRTNPCPFALWHWTNGPATYWGLSQHYKLPYSFRDFKDSGDSLSKR